MHSLKQNSVISVNIHSLILQKKQAKSNSCLKKLHFVTWTQQVQHPKILHRAEKAGIEALLNLSNFAGWDMLHGLNQTAKPAILC